MHFGFKSTFQKIKSSFLALAKLNHSHWILILNGFGAAIVLYLYFSNAVLPATIGSRPDGEKLVGALETGGRISLATSMYAVLFLLKSFLKKIFTNASARINAVASTIVRSMLIKGYVIVLLSQPLRRFQYSPAYTSAIICVWYWETYEHLYY
jgi:hypothetical protein